jgi:hypothetical protein
MKLVPLILCSHYRRFHQLPEFDQGKRSCRRRLAGHNERRRKQPTGPLASRYGRLAASFGEQRLMFPSNFLCLLITVNSTVLANLLLQFCVQKNPAGTEAFSWISPTQGFRAACGMLGRRFDQATVCPVKSSGKT